MQSIKECITFSKHQLQYNFMLLGLKELLCACKVSRLYLCATIILFLIISSFSYGQETEKTTAINVKFYTAINNKATSLENNIEKKSLQILQNLEKQESKLQKKLSLKDSVAAKVVFANSKYKQLAAQLKNPSFNKKLTEYIPQLDSLKTSLSFLKTPSPKGVLSSLISKENAQKIEKASKSMDAMQSKMQQANEIKNYVKERREYLKSQLQNFGLVKDMKKLNKQAYYYQQQLNEYKSLLKDRSKAEQKAMAALRKLPAFTAFMKKNSQLAQLFRLPDNYGTPQALAGLQTRASVQSLLQTRFGTSSISPPTGGAGGGYLQQQMSSAQAELSKLKDKIAKSPLSTRGEGVGGEDFKPNSQKTKSFMKRIEYGANVQSQKTNGFLPVTSDLALTAGYKLNDKSIVGIGASYKLGWGNGWQHIRLTNEGVGLRSYIDWKLKPIFGKIEGFWISGGYEKNYQSAYRSLSQLPSTPRGEGSGVRCWQTSGLIGMTKKYKIGKKTNNLQVLWDFLSYQQVPRRQPILFRVGYVF